jgi:integrase
MTAFLDGVLPAFVAACDLLERRAQGNYTPDTLPQTFPAFERKKPRSSSGLTGTRLFTAYIPAADLSEGSVRRWRTVFATLDQHLDGRSVEAFSEHEAQQWVAGLVTKKRKAFTVMNTWVPTLRGVCAWGLQQGLITANPFTKAEVKVPDSQQPKRKPPGRETKAFTNDEMKLILSNASAVGDTKQTANALRRWVPWLLAYTGARAGEITQLRAQDITARDGFVALRLTAEAGRIKTGEDRTVPLHHHIIDQGFLDYVRARVEGPLFYEADARTPKPKMTRADQARDELGRWIRSIGIADPKVRPNHAWRHTFKARAARAKIEKRIRDAICGPAVKNVGDEYETPTVEDLADAMRSFPRYEV